ncbi:MAG: response regulator [Chloroflexota bacterium]|nr:response regulator [Chloroflexota bacterium]
MARIVFCEDEEQIRKLIEVAMRSTAHTIELHVNGREGLEAIEREAPELIVTDLAMPEMGGFALADAVHARPALNHIPIMFVTASVQRGDVARFGEHGAAGYIAKPFSPRALRDKIDELITAAREKP